MDRRRLITVLGAGLAAPLVPLVFLGGNVHSAAPEAIRDLQARWRDFLPAGLMPPAAAPRVEKPQDAWKQELPGAAYRVLFEEDTERPFSSALNDEKRAGLYVCRACDLPLFTSEMKYDSGTGWPSFFTTIPEHLETKTDYKLIWPRTEYHCIRCGGHQGHIFDDGPAPTRERWCNNGLALTFVARDA